MQGFFTESIESVRMCNTEAHSLSGANLGQGVKQKKQKKNKIADNGLVFCIGLKIRQ